MLPENERPNWNQDLGPKIPVVPLQMNEGNGLDLHTTNFTNVVKSRDTKTLNAPIEIGYNTALVCHMGNIAYKAGNRVYWNKENMQFSDKTSNQLITLSIITDGNCENLKHLYRSLRPAPDSIIGMIFSLLHLRFSCFAV